MDWKHMSSNGSEWYQMDLESPDSLLYRPMRIVLREGKDGMITATLDDFDPDRFGSRYTTVGQFQNMDRAKSAALPLAMQLGLIPQKLLIHNNLLVLP